MGFLGLILLVGDIPESKVPPTGVEPAHPPPEGGALSTELRGLGYFGDYPSASPPRVSVKEWHPSDELDPLSERGGL